jgi:hypothetical protein
MSADKDRGIRREKQKRAKASKRQARAQRQPGQIERSPVTAPSKKASSQRAP